MVSKIYSLNKDIYRWLKLSKSRVLAISICTLFAFSACAPMTSVRNGLEYQAKLRDQVTGNMPGESDIAQEEDLSEQEDINNQMAKIAEFEEMLLAAKKEKAEVKTRIDKIDNTPTKIIQPEETKLTESAVAGVPSRDDIQDEDINKTNRKLLTFKEQFSSLENKHDQLATKVNQIEEELKFLRGQVIALNSRKETFSNKKNVAQAKTNNIIESEEKIAKKEDSVPQTKAEPTPAANNQNSDKQLELAEQFYNKGKYADAIDSYLKALDGIKSNNIKSETLYKVAMSHYHLKHYEKSINYFDKVCSLSENMFKDDAQIQIAEANMRLGKIDEAKKAYKNVLAVYPRSKHIPKARKMLQQL